MGTPHGSDQASDIWRRRGKIYARLGEGSRSGLQLDGPQLDQVKHIAGTFSKFATALDMTQFTTVLRGLERIH